MSLSSFVIIRSFLGLAARLRLPPSRLLCAASALDRADFRNADVADEPCCTDARWPWSATSPDEGKVQHVDSCQSQHSLVATAEHSPRQSSFGREIIHRHTETKATTHERNGPARFTAAADIIDKAATMPMAMKARHSIWLRKRHRDRKSGVCSPMCERPPMCVPPAVDSGYPSDKSPSDA